MINPSRQLFDRNINFDSQESSSDLLADHANTSTYTAQTQPAVTHTQKNYQFKDLSKINNTESYYSLNTDSFSGLFKQSVAGSSIRPVPVAALSTEGSSHSTQQSLINPSQMHRRESSGASTYQRFSAFSEFTANQHEEEVHFQNLKMTPKISFDQTVQQQIPKPIGRPLRSLINSHIHRDESKTETEGIACKLISRLTLIQSQPFAFELLRQDSSSPDCRSETTSPIISNNDDDKDQTSNTDLDSEGIWQYTPDPKYSKTPKQRNSKSRSYCPSTRIDRESKSASLPSEAMSSPLPRLEQNSNDHARWYRYASTDSPGILIDSHQSKHVCGNLFGVYAGKPGDKFSHEHSTEAGLKSILDYVVEQDNTAFLNSFPIEDQNLTEVTLDIVKKDSLPYDQIRVSSITYLRQEKVWCFHIFPVLPKRNT